MPYQSKNTATASTARTDQLAFWNGPAGRNWTDLQEVLDDMLLPISDHLAVRSSIAKDEYVIDVGCGCGASSIELGEKVGTTGRVIGIDISTDMLSRARLLTPAGPPIEYLFADATNHDFERDGADVVFSRFGVMFFPKPDLAFSNLYRALRPGGRIIFSCWRAPRENLWLTLPLQETYKHVPRLEELGPEDPGPFSFALEERVTRILRQAGFSSIALEAIDVSLDLAANRGLDQAVVTALAIGPASRALAGHPIEKAQAVETSIREALSRFQQGSKILLTGAIWIVTATKP